MARSDTKMEKAMIKVIQGLIRGYRFFLSALFGNCCRFYPSCSQYAEIAIGRFGIMKGGYLALRRVLRCHPWHEGGVDFVP